MKKTVIATLVVGGALGWIGSTLFHDTTDETTSEIAVTSNGRKAADTKLGVVKNATPSKHDSLKAEGGYVVDGALQLEFQLERATELIDLFAKQHDGQALVDLVVKLRVIAPESYPHIARIVSILDRDVGEDDLFEGTYDRDELARAIPNELYLWALEPENFNTVDVLVRFRAYSGIVLINSVEVPRTLVNCFVMEDDHFGSRRIGNLLKTFSSASVADNMLEALELGKITGKAKYEYFTKLLFDIPGENVDAYIEQQLGADVSDRERGRLSYYKSRRNPPRTGYLIRDVVDKTQAKQIGLKPGDIIFSYAGLDMSEMSLQAAQAKTTHSDPIMIIVMRDGAEVYFDADPGKLGVAGDNIKKK